MAEFQKKRKGSARLSVKNECARRKKLNKFAESLGTYKTVVNKEEFDKMRQKWKRG